MKKQRNQLILLLFAIFAAALLLVFVKQQNKKAEEEALQENAEIVIDEIDTDKITAFSYYCDGQKISYQKEGENWNCINHAELQLDNDKIQGLLANISSITASEKVSDVEYFGEYGLLEPSNTITIAMGDKTITYAIGNYNDIVAASYVRKNDETTIYLVSGGLTTAFGESPENYKKDEDTGEESSVEEESGQDTISVDEVSGNDVSETEE